MSVVTIAEAWPAAGRPFTVAELDRMRLDQVGGPKFTEPPLLVVEIRSPGTALVDLNRNKAAYERFGVPSYWIVSSDLAQPEVTIFELRDGRYTVETTTPAPFTANRPFKVAVDPARLIRGVRRLPTCQRQ